MAKFEKDQYYWWKSAKLYNYADILLKLCQNVPKYEQKYLKDFLIFPTSVVFCAALKTF